MSPLRVFLLVAVPTVLAVTLLPAAIGPTRYSSLIAINLVMTLAVIATAVYAAANLREFKKAREAEYTPVLDIALRAETAPRLEQVLRLELRNIGRGAAAGVEVALWRMDQDLVMWIPHRIQLERDLLLSGETARGEITVGALRESLQRHFRPSLPPLVLQLRYRDALQRRKERFIPYERPSDDGSVPDATLLEISPLPVPSELSSAKAKQQLLDETLEEIAERTGLATQGLEIEGRVTRRKSVALVRDGDVVRWRAEIGADDPLFHISEWFERAAPDILRASQEDRREEGQEEGEAPAQAP